MVAEAIKEIIVLVRELTNLTGGTRVRDQPPYDTFETQSAHEVLVSDARLVPHAQRVALLLME